METRLYFLIGDLSSCVLVAIVTASICSFIFSSSWPMPLLMIVSMLVGMILGLLVAVLAGLIYFFGAMEIMVPSMMTGMFAGMLGAMFAAGAGSELAPGINYGSLIMQSALLGLGVSVAIRVYSMVLSGRKAPF